jgi:hypothetical protein
MESLTCAEGTKSYKCFCSILLPLPPHADRPTTLRPWHDMTCKFSRSLPVVWDPPLRLFLAGKKGKPLACNSRERTFESDSQRLSETLRDSGIPCFLFESKSTCNLKLTPLTMSCHELSTFSQTSLGFIWSGYLACWMSDGLALLGCHEVTSSHNVSLPGPTWSFWKNTPMSALNQPLKSLGKSAFSFWYLLMLFGSEPTTAVRRFLGYKWGSRSKRYKRRTWIHLIDLIWLVDTLHLGPLGLRCEDKSVLVCIDWSTASVEETGNASSGVLPAVLWSELCRLLRF